MAPAAPSSSWWPSPDPTGLQPALASYQAGGLPGGPCWGPGPLRSQPHSEWASPSPAMLSIGHGLGLVVLGWPGLTP